MKPIPSNYLPGDWLDLDQFNSLSVEDRIKHLENWYANWMESYPERGHRHALYNTVQMYSRMVTESLKTGVIPSAK